ncbi:MAG: 3-hydroxyacyl-ACP dehydratase FabZ family protein [Pirellulaceae bacterium]
MSDISIADTIPHRSPMLLVDNVVDSNEHEITCSKRFREDEFFFQGHYPEQPLVPGVILCECAAQAAAVLLAHYHVEPGQMAEQVPVLTRMNKVKFKKTVHPGDEIEIHVKLNQTLSGAFFLAATLKHDGKTAVTLELACTLAPKSITQQA